MSRFWWFRLFSSLTILGCSAPCPRFNSPQVPPVVVHEVGGDPAFTDSERGAIEDAALRLEYETRGRVVLRVSFTGQDLGWNLVRDVVGDPAVVWADQFFKAECYAWREGPIVHVVADRHSDARSLTHTTMHELVHLLGVPHVRGNPRSLMAPSSDARSAPLTLSGEDRNAIAKALTIPTW